MRCEAQVAHEVRGGEKLRRLGAVAVPSLGTHFLSYIVDKDEDEDTGRVEALFFSEALR